MEHDVKKKYYEEDIASIAEVLRIKLPGAKNRKVTIKDMAAAVREIENEHRLAEYLSGKTSLDIGHNGYNDERVIIPPFKTASEYARHDNVLKELNAYNIWRMKNAFNFSTKLETINIHGTTNIFQDEPVEGPFPKIIKDSTILSTGEIYYENGVERTDYTYCHGLDTIEYIWPDPSVAHSAFYDAEKKPIASRVFFATGDESDSVEVPENAYYFIASCYNDEGMSEGDGKFTWLNPIDPPVIVEDYTRTISNSFNRAVSFKDIHLTDIDVVENSFTNINSSIDTIWLTAYGYNYGKSMKIKASFKGFTNLKRVNIQCDRRWPIIFENSLNGGTIDKDLVIAVPAGLDDLYRSNPEYGLTAYASYIYNSDIF